MAEILITEESYNKSFRSLFETFKIDQKFILQTKVHLPFQIPVPDGYVVISNIDDRSEYWSMLFFLSKNVDKKLSIFDGDISTAVRRTEVNFCIIGPEFNLDSYEEKDIEIALSDEMSHFFDRSLDHLNAIIIAYSIHFQDEYVYQITKLDLPSFCGYELIDIKSWTVKSILFGLHNKIDVEMKYLNLQQCTSLQKFTNHIVTNDYIFLLPEKYLLSAKRKFNEGQFSESVTFAQTAIEVKIKRLFYYFLQNEGLCEIRINELMENTPFMSVIKKEISKRLGGVWDITKEGSEIKDWYDKCYLLRNRVIHTGYVPELNESQQALNCSKAFVFYILQLIAKKKKDYPELFKNLKIEL